MNKNKKILIFSSFSQKSNATLRLPKHEINKNTIEREIMSKFLGGILDENLTWKANINTLKQNINKLRSLA